MNKLTKRTKKWIALLIITLVLGAIIIFAVSEYFSREGEISFGGLIRAETFYVIVVFLILIPVLLGALLLAIIFGKKDDDAEDPEVVSLPFEASESSSVPDTEEERGERF